MQKILPPYLSESLAKTIDAGGIVVDVRPYERGARMVVYFEGGWGSEFALTGGSSVARVHDTAHGRVRVTIEVLP